MAWRSSDCGNNIIISILKFNNGRHSCDLAVSINFIQMKQSSMCSIYNPSAFGKFCCVGTKINEVKKRVMVMTQLCFTALVG